MFADKVGISLDNYKIRFLFKGQELIDEIYYAIMVLKMIQKFK